MNVKKIFSIVLFGAMCLGFVSCEEEELKVDNNNSTEQTDPDGNSSGGGTTNPTTPTYTVTLSVNDEAMGTVTGGGEYEEGAEVTLEATANDGYKFVKWSDEETENPRTITITADVTLIANFRAIDFNGHEYVDLGLPSGTLWATCNVGATSPEEYGDYFAWGEVEPKTYYDWSSEGDYKWGVINWDDTENYGMTKYNKTDGKTVLDLEDDAAVNWGGDWRMPTFDEQKELLDTDNCTWEWITQNGVYGRKVTSVSNSNSIFLPAAGYRYGSSLVHAGSGGYYWSSSLYTSYPSNAYGLLFYADYFVWNYNVRYYGLSVRAVCSAK